MQWNGMEWNALRRGGWMQWLAQPNLCRHLISSCWHAISPPSRPPPLQGLDELDACLRDCVRASFESRQAAYMEEVRTRTCARAHAPVHLCRRASLSACHAARAHNCRPSMHALT